MWLRREYCSLSFAIIWNHQGLSKFSADHLQVAALYFVQRRIFTGVSCLKRHETLIKSHNVCAIIDWLNCRQTFFATLDSYLNVFEYLPELATQYLYSCFNGLVYYDLDFRNGKGRIGLEVSALDLKPGDPSSSLGVAHETYA
jgi:hypothetical protein